MFYMFKSKLGLLNFIILQWLFVRLCVTVDEDGSNPEYSILKWVVPLTGWWSSYVFLLKGKK